MYTDVKDISEVANEFKEHGWELTDFEALKLAIMFIRTEIEAENMKLIQYAFNVPPDHDRDNTPSALGRIAEQLKEFVDFKLCKGKIIKERKEDEFIPF